jgi:hypothetical protein
MKNDFERLKLLDALLADETWDTCSGQVHHNGLAALRATKKSRGRHTTAVQMIAVIAVFSAAATVLIQPERGWLSRSSVESAGPSPQQATPAPLQSTTAQISYITEDQMVAMFPEGSCVLAEIDGHKQLVVLDETGALRRPNGLEIQ